ncbi:signal transduction histidine kinase [Luteimonas cucumeris]|uniref:histidine kinase n=1 Tax=Luteimonas cucumeris TaxID=985012 RepID=A0A562L4W5_9GAMM|nr:HAMP domain-containing sensor histidine kinase [Luteimonas cucumeris]TWI02727.1 signal transduction histidine kinase [Luteimonas cucumeris]
MSQGLSRKIRIAFILQAVIASFVIVIGVFAINSVLKQGLLERRLQSRVAEYWQSWESDPGQRQPIGIVVKGFVVPTGLDNGSLPPVVSGLARGFHELPASNQIVYVDERPAGRLYLIYDEDFVDELSLWLGVVPTLFALLSLYAVSWLTYRTSRRLVEPVSWLARQVAHWDPRQPDTEQLAPERLPAALDGEVRQLADALHGLAVRVDAFVSRERAFTRDASHELRTPLTVIRVATDLLLADPDLPPRTQRSLQRIQFSGRDMEAVIDAFLVLAREADIAPQSEDFNVRDVVYEEVVNLRPLLAGKPVQLEVIEDASPRLHAPPRILGVMVGNLLSNAVNFTDEGRIEVRIGADRIVVRDSGIGMSREELDKAFEPFYRADQAHPVGKGIGLSVVRRLGERLGWSVTLDSALGEGTTATIGFAGLRPV